MSRDNVFTILPEEGTGLPDGVVALEDVDQDEAWVVSEEQADMLMLLDAVKEDILLRGVLSMAVVLDYGDGNVSTQYIVDASGGWHALVGGIEQLRYRLLVESTETK